jgi:Ala-tRNA(Pro) deacylase
MMGSSKRDDVFRKLAELGIRYEKIEHEAAFTVEDMERIGFDEKVTVCKNLFVRDQKKKATHWLVVLHKDKRADLHSLAEQLGTNHLSFASGERLRKYLGLSQGEVTPLGVISDRERSVIVVFDRDLVGNEHLGVHPNDNTATLIMSFEDIRKVVEDNGNPIRYVTVEGEAK